MSKKQVIRTCSNCGKRECDENFFKCSRCKLQYYCDNNCQRQHWSSHKLLCKPVTISRKDMQKLATAVINNKPLLKLLFGYKINNNIIVIKLNDKNFNNILLDQNQIIKHPEEYIFGVAGLIPEFAFYVERHIVMEEDYRYVMLQYGDHHDTTTEIVFPFIIPRPGWKGRWDEADISVKSFSAQFVTNIMQQLGQKINVAVKPELLEKVVGKLDQLDKCCVHLLGPEISLTIQFLQQ